MSKLRLVGLTAERDDALNALAATGCVEIKECPVPENTFFLKETEALNKIGEKAERLERGIGILTHAAEEYVRVTKIKCDFLEESFEATYKEFVSAPNRQAELFAVCDRAEELSAKKTAALNERLRLEARYKSLTPYAVVDGEFANYTSTRYTEVYLGLIPSERYAEFIDYADNTDAVDVVAFGETSGKRAVLFVAHKQIAEQAYSALSSFGFERCPFYQNKTAKALMDECVAGMREQQKIIEQTETELFSNAEFIKPLKILYDYYGFESEKLTWAEKFPGTKASFVLEAYVPKEAQEKVSFAINGVSDNIYYEFAEIEEDEMPPTLMKNNKVVKNFEFVTNMYTPPNYREFDPNTVMSVFFSIFLGFIMADIGYALLMMAIGFFMGFRSKRDTGMRRLMLVIGYGGIFTLIFGLMFNSFFGVTVPFLPTIIPNAQTHSSTLVGISIPTVLLIALGMGVVQLIVSNLCKAYQEIRYGRVLDGIFFGGVWALFLVGMLLAVLGLIEEVGMPQLAIPGAILAVAMLVLGACTAGIHERGLGKFTKGFGAVYGIINYLSDILSYARLYGLMLSGAIIAQIASGESFKLIASGNPMFIALAVIILIIGHGFNLAMGLLGGYIHDARLQYIEFFSRFYGGEGELFKPLGSTHKYVKIYD